MNGRTAKKLKKIAFGEKASSARGRKHQFERHYKNTITGNKKYINTTIHCAEPRATYLQLKNDYKKGKVKNIGV